MISKRMTFFLIGLVLLLNIYLVAEERGNTSTDVVTRVDLDSRLTELEQNMWSKLVAS